MGVAIAWDPVSTPGVSGYVVYYGITNNNFTTRVDVGTNTTATITGLTSGQTNYFIVTAYNAAKVEGLPSASLKYVVPNPVKITGHPKKGSPASVTFLAAPSHYYVVEASTDMKTWTPVYQTSMVTSNGWMTFEDPETSSFEKRFYRLAQH
ncbi:MAG: fibronectin type protein [Pedosphaera sp.]|nr:fibronectin type protein [Pedosphaera sp.]